MRGNRGVANVVGRDILAGSVRLEEIKVRT